MADIKRICIKENGFLSGFLMHMQVMEHGISLSNSQHGGYISQVLDSTETGTQWGRLILEGEFNGDCEFTTYALAVTNDTITRNNKNQKLDKVLKSQRITFEEKIEILETQGAQVSVNLHDVLLTHQTGRYFVFAVQLFSAKSAIIKSASIISPPETLMAYLPEVFSSSESNFLERYMAIFGTIFNDRKEALAKLPNYLDINRAPENMLPILTRWLGLGTCCAFLDTEQLRKILKMAKEISQFKGTKRILEEVLSVFLRTKPIIMEQFKWQKYTENEFQDNFENSPEFTILIEEFEDEDKTQDNCENLYGSSFNEFTILIKESVDETVFLQLKNLIEMLTPIQAKANIIFLDKCCALDKYTYADINSTLRDAQISAVFDRNDKLDSASSFLI
ncbi:MAG: hypothetical protein LBJ83_01935 [Oscillospiraceae bacterium]|jgi:phage tail-like protein|nr:hypothetical protein [Oscillospiraceae bacterium]